MSWDLAKHPSRLPLLAVAAACAVLVAALAAAAVLGSRTAFGPPGPAPRQSGLGRPPAAPAPPGGASTPTPDALRLPAPTRTTGGAETGYPHTAAGAVSAAVHYLSEMTSLDPARAAQVAAAVTDPSWQGAAQQAAQLSQAMRRQLRLPATGAVANAYVEVEPMRFETRDAGPDRVDVWILADLSLVAPQVPAASAQQVLAAPLRWTGGDWKLTGDAAAGPRPSATDPGWRGFDD